MAKMRSRGAIAKSIQLITRHPFSKDNQVFCQNLQIDHDHSHCYDADMTCQFQYNPSSFNGEAFCTPLAVQPGVKVYTQKDNGFFFFLF